MEKFKKIDFSFNLPQNVKTRTCHAFKSHNFKKKQTKHSIY